MNKPYIYLKIKVINLLILKPLQYKYIKFVRFPFISYKLPVRLPFILLINKVGYATSQFLFLLNSLPVRLSVKSRLQFNY